MEFHEFRLPHCGRLERLLQVALVAGWALITLFAALPADAARLHPRVVIGDERDSHTDPGRSSAGVNDEHMRVELSDYFQLGEYINYDRVDGLGLGLTQHITGRSAYAPEINLMQARALARGRWIFSGDIEQPLWPDRLSIGGAFFRITLPFDGLDHKFVRDMENLLAALLIKEDFRDYYEEEGGELNLRLQFLRHASLQGAVVRSTHRAVANSTSFSLTRWDDDFRPNPAADEGDLRALRVEFEYDSRPAARTPSSSQWYRVQWERAGAELGGDFEYARWKTDFRQYLRTSPGQQLSIRVIYGVTETGQLPIQKRFAIGGIGTLRGHAFKEFIGDEVLLANIEYRIDMGRHFMAIGFLDSGATANIDQSVIQQRFALDGGFGFGFHEERAAVYIAHDLRDADADFKFYFRLSSTF